MPVGSNISVPSPKRSVTLKIRLVTAWGSPDTVMELADGGAESRTFVRTVKTEGPTPEARTAVMEGEIAARSEYSGADRENELEVRGITKRRSRDAHAPGRSCAPRPPSSDDATHRVAPGASVRMDGSRSKGKKRWPWSAVTTVAQHRRSLVCESLAPGCDDCIHHLPSLESEACLAA